MDACHPYLGCAPEGQRQLAEFLHVELAVLYFPFSLNDPILATTQADRPSDLPAFLSTMRRLTVKPLSTYSATNIVLPQTIGANPPTTPYSQTPAGMIMIRVPTRLV
jgi:hypothetical protein